MFWKKKPQYSPVEADASKETSDTGRLLHNEENAEEDDLGIPRRSQNVRGRFASLWRNAISLLLGLSIGFFLATLISHSFHRTYPEPLKTSERVDRTQDLST
jgi:hypothetical protein